MNRSTLVNIGLSLLLLVFLVAPFTFLKPKFIKQTLTDSTGKITEKAAQRFRIKKVFEKPLHDVFLPDFAAIRDVKSKKKKFFDFIRPAVVRQNNAIFATRAKLNIWLEQVSLGLPLSMQEYHKLNALVKRYRVNKDASPLTQLNELLVRVDVVPMPLVLVQAANESAWGTSRFSRIGLNFFGIWCYQQGCGMVPGNRDTGAKHEVAAFKSLDEAVVHYFYNINSHNAYRVFRAIRFELRSKNQPLNPEILATGLLAYSERGADYVMDITKMLRHNQEYLVEANVKLNVAIED